MSVGEVGGRKQDVEQAVESAADLYILFEEEGRNDDLLQVTISGFSPIIDAFHIRTPC